MNASIVPSNEGGGERRWRVPHPGVLAGAVERLGESGEYLGSLAQGPAAGDVNLDQQPPGELRPRLQQIRHLAQRGDHRPGPGPLPARGADQRREAALDFEFIGIG